MTRIIATALVAFSVAGAAQAMTSASDIETALRQIAPTVDASTLTEAERVDILSVLLSGDSDSEKRAVINAIAN